MGWLIASCILALLIRWWTKAIVLRGSRVNMYLTLAIAAGSGALVSAACSFTLAQDFPGTYAPVILSFWWIAATLFLATWLAQRPRREREEWQRMEMRFFDTMTGGGLIVGAMLASFILSRASS